MSEFHIVEYDEVAKQIEEVKEYSNFLPDVTTKEGYEKSKRVSLDIGKILTSLEKVRKDKKAYFLNGGKEVDIQAKRIASQLEDMQLPHKDAYKELDNLKKQMEQERKQKLEDRIEFMRTLPESMSDSSSDEIKCAMNDLINETCEDFYEYTAQALKTRNESQKQLADLFTKVQKAEKDAIELEALREKQRIQDQKDHDERVAREARQAAEAEAKAAREAVEREKAEAIQREEAAKAEIERQKKLSEQMAIDAEKKRIADIESARQDEIARQEAEAEALKAEAEKREANKKYLAKVHNAILDVLMRNGISEDDAKTMIKLAAKGELPQLTINY